MNNWRILKICKIILLVIAAICLFGLLVMKLWNWLMPEIFGLTTITFVQALGILVLSKILFSGLKPGGGPGHAAKERWKGNFFRKRWEKKMANLSPEEREKLKSEYRKNWSWCGEEEEENENK